MKDTMLILHFIGLAMGLGTSFTHAFLAKTLSKLGRSEAAKFQLQLKALSQMGTIGTLLLLFSGIYLILPYWSALLLLPLLMLKLVLFFILIVLILLINQVTKKNIKNGTEDNLKGIETMGKLTLIIAIAIVILAVSIFH